MKSLGDDAAARNGWVGIGSFTAPDHRDVVIRRHDVMSHVFRIEHNI